MHIDGRLVASQPLETAPLVQRYFLTNGDIHDSQRMRLTDYETDRLLVFLAAKLARKRRENGVKLGYPETVALISDEILEAARAGTPYKEVLDVGRTAVDKEDVLDGVPAMVDTVQVEALFPEGFTLVTLTDPFE